jgi:hypothetical protein
MDRGQVKDLLRQLNRVPTEKLVPTVHYANRLLQRRDLVTDPDVGLIIRGAAGEPQPDEADLAQKLVKQFAESEGTRLQELTDPQADAYINLLSRIVQRRSRRENPMNPARAAKVREILSTAKTNHGR